MKTPRTQLAAAIGERTLHERDVNKLAREIAAYLLSENREHELGSLMRDVMAFRQARGVVEATMLTAHELGEGVDIQVQQLLKEHFPKAKHVIVRETRDDNIVGGLKVQMAHEQLDMSIRAKLDNFKRLTTEGNL